MPFATDKAAKDLFKRPLKFIAENSEKSDPSDESSENLIVNWKSAKDGLVTATFKIEQFRVRYQPNGIFCPILGVDTALDHFGHVYAAPHQPSMSLAACFAAVAR